MSNNIYIYIYYITLYMSIFCFTVIHIAFGANFWNTYNLYLAYLKRIRVFWLHQCPEFWLMSERATDDEHEIWRPVFLNEWSVCEVNGAKSWKSSPALEAKSDSDEICIRWVWIYISWAFDTGEEQNEPEISDRRV